MLPTDTAYGTWAASGEFDILEARGQEPTLVSSTLHYGGVWPNNVYTTSGKLDMKTDTSAAYHTYAMEWEENQVRFYFDSNMIYSLPLNKYGNFAEISLILGRGVLLDDLVLIHKRDSLGIKSFIFF
jgi:beta-glucanase (GH16 family)